MPEARENMFSWFGNGLTVAQEKGEKTTQYLDEVDVPPTINHGPRPSRLMGGVQVETSLKNGGFEQVSEGISVVST